MSRPERLDELHAARDHLLASLADLERERAAGDVAAADYEALRQRYVARTAAVLRAISAAEAAPERAPAGRWRGLRRRLGRPATRRGLWAGVVVCLLGALVVVAASLAGLRLPGQSATGSVALPPAGVLRQELVDARLLGSEGEVQAAIALYDRVLAAVPHQPEALTYRGWLVRLVGVAAGSRSAIARGDAQLAEAVRVAPRYPDARALYGLALADDRHAFAAAAAQLRAFLADRPPASLLEPLRPAMARVFERAGEPVPAALATGERRAR
ncbi:MAG TPA: hypothetical protein VKV23_03040 [Acidimicrobiales bacterium]|nr:hypothetical protein [Acidimicrobiales bacterium]